MHQRLKGLMGVGPFLKDNHSKVIRNENSKTRYPLFFIFRYGADCICPAMGSCGQCR